MLLRPDAVTLGVQEALEANDVHEGRESAARGWRTRTRTRSREAATQTLAFALSVDDHVDRWQLRVRREAQHREQVRVRLAVVGRVRRQQHAAVARVHAAERSIGECAPAGGSMQDAADNTK